MKAQTIVWLVCCVAALALIAILIIAASTGILDDDEESLVLAFGCFLPVCMMGLAAWGLWLGQRWMVEDRANKRGRANLVGRCPSCGYDTSGLTGCCPECGSPVTTAAWVPKEGAARAPWRIRRWSARQQGLVWFAVVLVLIASFATAFIFSAEEPRGLFCCMLPLVAGPLLAWGVWIVWHWEESSF